MCNEDVRVCFFCYCRLCELHTESKKPYEIEIGFISDATQQRFVRIDKERRFASQIVLMHRDGLVRDALKAIEETGNEEMDVE